MKFHSTVLFVHDIERAKDFYTPAWKYPAQNSGIRFLFVKKPLYKNSF